MLQANRKVGSFGSSSQARAGKVDVGGDRVGQQHTDLTTHQRPAAPPPPLASQKAATNQASQEGSNRPAKQRPPYPPTCTLWRLPRLRQLGMPPAGPHAQIIHQDAAALQLEAKLALQCKRWAGAGGNQPVQAVANLFEGKAVT